MNKKDTRKTPYKGAFNIDQDRYQIFKYVCKKNNSDASKELRKFVAHYLATNDIDLNQTSYDVLDNSFGSKE